MIPYLLEELLFAQALCLRHPKLSESLAVKNEALQASTFGAILPMQLVQI